MERNYSMRPLFLQALRTYKETGKCCNDVVFAVLSGNLATALAEIDAYDKTSIPSMIGWCWDNLPDIAWGSATKVLHWKGLNVIGNTAGPRFLECK